MFKGRRAFRIMRLMGGGGGRLATFWYRDNIVDKNGRMPTCQQVDKGLKRGWQIFDRPHLSRFISLPLSLPSPFPPFLLFRLLPVRKYGCRFENETERGLKGGVDGRRRRRRGGGGVVNRLGKGDSCTVSKGNLQRNLVYCRENDGWSWGWRGGVWN